MEKMILLILGTVESLLVTQVSFGMDLIFWQKMKYFLTSNSGGLIFLWLSVMLVLKLKIIL